MYDYDYPMGDARRCPSHPHIKTSSDDGLHDAPCGECEHESWLTELDRDMERDLQEEVKTPRQYTQKELLAMSPGMAEYLLQQDDDIPF
jgi:hypothetical protein